LSVGRDKFKELIVWQRAKDIAVRIYIISNEGALNKDLFKSLDKECQELGKMIGSLIKARKK